MISAPLKWVEILALRSTLFNKAVKVAKANCSLPAQRSRVATLLVTDINGKSLLSSHECPFPSCAADWAGMIKKVKEVHPQAHTLHLQVGVNSSTGNQGFVRGRVKEWTGSAQAPVFTYPDYVEFQQAA